MWKSLINKKIAILGLGVSGKACAEFLLKKDAQVVGFDTNQTVLSNDLQIECLKTKGLITQVSSSFEDFDLVIKSPGIPNDHIWIKTIKKNTRRIPIVGEIDLACYELKNARKKLVGITGSNGKTTTTLLVTHVLNELGIKSKALGNIGTPLITECTHMNESQTDIYVVELSSYQLESLKIPVFDVGTILNITPNHLDRYSNFKAYTKAKLNLEKCIKKEGSLILQDHVFYEFGHLLKKITPETYGYKLGSSFFCNRQEVYYKGMLAIKLPQHLKGLISHEVENLIAAFAICQKFGIDAQGFLKAYQTFTKPPHRIEFVDKFNGITFINDSKATSVDAVIKAVQSLPNGIILIAGGVDKGGSYEPWISSFKGKVKKILAIGSAATKIKEQIAKEIEVEVKHSLEEAVYTSYTIAKEGDCILLSPGCSSFDMFKDYAHRGDEFKRIVSHLSYKRDQ